MVENTPRETPGIAGFASKSFGTRERRTGDILEKTFTYTVKAGQLLPIDLIVGFEDNDPTGEIVPATYNADPDLAVKPSGARTASVDTSAAAGGACTIDVARTGSWNPNYMVWHDSFDTEAKRKLAFEGSPSPTQVMIQAVPYDNTADVPVELKSTADLTKA